MNLSSSSKTTLERWLRALTTDNFLMIGAECS
jgi:hypothetical protein